MIYSSYSKKSKAHLGSRPIIFFSGPGIIILSLHKSTQKRIVGRLFMMTQLIFYRPRKKFSADRSYACNQLILFELLMMAEIFYSAVIFETTL